MVIGLMFGAIAGGGKTSEGRGIRPGSLRGHGAVIVPCAGMTGEFASLLVSAGANSPPTPLGLPAGQRGCLAGSQPAFRRPLAVNCRAQSMISLVETRRLRKEQAGRAA